MRMNYEEIYNKGKKYEEFLAEQREEDKEVLEGNYKKLTVSRELIDKIKEISRHLHVLVFAEGWCPDCQVNLPVLRKMVDISGKLDMRILPRSGNEDIMEPFYIDGKPKIPTFVFLNKDFEIIGMWIERPDVVKKLLSDEDEDKATIAKMDYLDLKYSEETIKEILEVLNIS